MFQKLFSSKINSHIVIITLDFSTLYMWEPILISSFTRTSCGFHIYILEFHWYVHEGIGFSKKFHHGLVCLTCFSLAAFIERSWSSSDSTAASCTRFLALDAAAVLRLRITCCLALCIVGVALSPHVRFSLYETAVGTPRPSDTFVLTLGWEGAHRLVRFSCARLPCWTPQA